MCFILYFLWSKNQIGFCFFGVQIDVFLVAKNVLILDVEEVQIFDRTMLGYNWLSLNGKEN